MIIHKEVQQQTLEWYRLKWGKVSGTRMKALMVNKPVKETVTYFEILQEIQEDFDEESIELDSYPSKDAQRGVIMEPFAVVALEEHLGVEFEEFGFIELENGLGLSPDRLTNDMTIGAEVKCPTGKVHIQYIKSKWNIPPVYVDQAVQYFVVNKKLKVLYWMSYRPENKVQSMYIVKLTLDTYINKGTDRTPITMTIEEAVSLAENKYEQLETELNE